MMLVKSWGAVAQVLAAEKRLGSELEAFLRKLFEDLRLKLDDDWDLRTLDDAHQMYLARRRWRAPTEYAVWVGVERFGPEQLFGKDDFASIYLWVQIGGNLVSVLAEAVRCAHPEITDVPSKRSRYAAERKVPKLAAAEALDQYLPSLHDYISEWLTRFARVAMSHEEAILRAVAGAGGR
ncbi:MAG: hypothetical protein ABSG61_10740 [Gemmatimonadales bacterium]